MRSAPTTRPRPPPPPPGHGGFRFGRVVIRTIVDAQRHPALETDYSLSAFYRRLLANGKSRMAALFACMRNPLLILDHLLRANKTEAARQNP